MFKRIFTKYFTITTTIIIISFYVLGATLFFFFSQYVMTEKRNSMLENGRQIAALYSSILTDYTLPMDYYLGGMMSVVSTAQGVHVVIGTTNGRVFICTDSGDCAYHTGDIPESFIQRVDQEGEVTMVDTLEGFFQERNLIVAFPVRAESGDMIGVLVLATENQLSPIIYADIGRVFFVSSLLVMIVVFIAIFFVTRRLVTPLWAMNNAAKKMAKGNFDVSIPVKGDDEVAELTIAFNNMADSLRVMEDMRKAFMWNVSHELKTPMTVISGFIEGILDGTIPPEQEKKYLKIVHTEVLRLSRMVGDLLEVARIESGTKKVNPMEFDLCEMLTRAMLSYEKKVSEKGISVEFHTPQESVKVWGDVDDLYRVAYNLIDNAVKFANQDGQIDVSIVPGDKKVFVSVKNTGQGISAEDIKHIFDRFYKSDKSRSLDRTGVGLGLHIVKTLLDLHEEEIAVNSVEGEYCEFVFTVTTEAKKQPDKKLEKKNTKEAVE